MKAWKDSANPPTDAEIAAAKAGGVDGWAGYFKFAASDNVYIGWADDDFRRVQAGGLRTLAFCSGLDTPTLCADRAAKLGIQVWLDDESGMRPVGGWEQAWIDSAGSGIYGNAPSHVGISAPLGHIYAGYFGYDPGTTWPSSVPRPSGPLGWQWQGTHAQYGVSLDNDWFDDAIGGLYGGANVAISKFTGRVYTVIMGNKAFQAIRGKVDANNQRGLFFRRFDAGAWTPFVVVGGNLATDDLGTEDISPVVDAAGNISITVTGTSGDLWDAVSTDGGDTFTWIKNGGYGDGLIGVSASSGALQPDLSPVLAAVADLRAHPAVIESGALQALVQEVDDRIKNLTLRST